MDRFKQRICEPVAKDCNSLAALQEIVEGLAIHNEIKKEIRPGCSVRVSALASPPEFKARHGSISPA